MVRFMVNALTAYRGGPLDKPEMGQSDTIVHRFLRSRARCFISAAGMVINARDRMEKTLSLALSLAVSIADTSLSRYVYFASSAETDGPPLFFSNNGAIFGAAEMEIYLITDTRRARVTAAVVRDTWFVLSDVDYALMEYYRYSPVGSRGTYTP